MKAPCLNCEDRTITCHSECEKYKDFRYKLDTFKATKEEFDYSNYLYDAINRMQSVRISK